MLLTRQMNVMVVVALSRLLFLLAGSQTHREVGTESHGSDRIIKDSRVAVPELPE